MKIKVAFYKGKGDFVNTVVRWWTNSVYSHAELVLPNNVTWIGISPFLTSTVESRFHLDCDYHNWDFVDLEITNNRSAQNVIKDFDEWKKNSEYKFVELRIENDESTSEIKLYFEDNVHGNSRVSEIDQRFFKSKDYLLFKDIAERLKDYIGMKIWAPVFLSRILSLE